MTITAILIECDPGNTLGGSCIRDVHNVATFLLRNGVDGKNIHITLTNLSEKKMDNVVYSPSRDVLNLIDNIVLSSGDTLIVLLSGHGYTKQDYDGDEVDHRDEYVNVGKIITDDMFYEHVIMKHNIDGVNMLLLSDTCHSGTMFDLPFKCDQDSLKLSVMSKRTDRLNVNAISLSACTDSQLSMCDIGYNAGYGGSLTVALLEYEDVFRELISMNYKNTKKIFNRLRLLSQTGLLCVSRE